MVRVRLKHGGVSRFAIPLLVFICSVSCTWTPIYPVWERRASDTRAARGTTTSSSSSSSSERSSSNNGSSSAGGGGGAARGDGGKGSAPPSAVLAFRAFGREFKVVLRETAHLIHENFTTHHHNHLQPNPHGQPRGGAKGSAGGAAAERPPLAAGRHGSNEAAMVVNRIGRKGSEGCHWQGHLAGSPGSSAALSVCPQLGGIIWTDSEAYHLHSNATHSLIARSTDLVGVPTTFKCGYNRTTTTTTTATGTATATAEARRSRSRRDAAALTDVRRPPSTVSGESRFVEMVIVHDHRQFVKFERNETALFERSKQVANIVNALYAPLNIFVLLVGVQVWSKKDEIDIDPVAENTLDNFLRYRMEVLVRSLPNDNAQLITDMTFAKDVVGKALKGPICTYQYSGGVNKDHHDSVAVVAATIAHELGHNFGMEHDDVAQCFCPQPRCIMYPASNTMVPPTAWSSCSIEAVRESFAQHMDHCLRNVPSRVVGPSCGNGVVEEGEECDCGPPGACATTCCDPHTCRRAPGAQCAHGRCCNLAAGACRPLAAGTACRPAAGECDLAEHCDGQQADCPSDVFAANGVACGDGQAFCYMGSCSSHNMQCRKLWGPTGNMGHKSCFSVNVNGTQIGNCGYDKIKKTYTKCKQKDIMCGTLHCTHMNERLEYGMLSAAKLSRFFLRTDRESYPCRSAMVDLGTSDPDPGQAADGAACGAGRACLAGHCVAVDQLASPACEYDCFGHGRCNHLGHCHCDPGYAPPYCNFPGSGGSVDSGPLTNPDEESYTLTIVLGIMFLGVAPLVIFFTAWTIFSKKDFASKWRLRRRKLAVKHAARHRSATGLLNLYDKAPSTRPSISKPLRPTAAAPVTAITAPTTGNNNNNGGLAVNNQSSSDVALLSPSSVAENTTGALTSIITSPVAVSESLYANGHCGWNRASGLPSTPSQSRLTTTASAEGTANGCTARGQQQWSEAPNGAAPACTVSGTIRPVRPAPPPPKKTPSGHDGTNTSSKSFLTIGVPVSTTTTATTANCAYQAITSLSSGTSTFRPVDRQTKEEPVHQAISLKRGKSTHGSIRRPSAPPPPLPVNALDRVNSSPLYENIENLHAEGDASTRGSSSTCDQQTSVGRPS